MKNKQTHELVKDRERISALLSTKTCFIDIYKKYGITDIELVTACIQEGLPDLLAVLIEKGANLSAFPPLLTVTKSIDDFTLDEEKQKSYLACFQLLKEKGINIDGGSSDTALHDSARAGKWGFCEVLLEAGANPLIKNIDGWLPLHKACIVKGSVNFLKRVLAYPGADVNDQNYEGNSALHVAAAFGQAEAVHFLISSGAEINIANYKGETPLDFARYSNSLDVINVLSSYHARSYSEEKARFQHSFTPKLAQIYNKTFLSGADIDSLTPEDLDLLIHKSIDDQNLDKAFFFVKKGGSINTQGSDGETLLQLAAKAGRQETCYSLIKEGADVTIKDITGSQAVHKACSTTNCKNFIEYLVRSHGVDINAHNYYGDTPLHLAVKSSNIDILKRLIELGGAINAVNAEGDTPMHVAAKLGFEDVMNALAESGADLYVPNRRELTPDAYSSKE